MLVSDDPNPLHGTEPICILGELGRLEVVGLDESAIQEPGTSEVGEWVPYGTQAN